MKEGQVTQGKLSRRDFIKLGGAAAVAWWLEETGIARAMGAEDGKKVESGGITEGQFFSPKNTSIILVPIGRDGFYSNTKSPVSLNLNADVILQARNVQTIKINGADIKVAEVPFAGGDIPGVKDMGIPANTDQYLAFAIVESQGKAFYGKKYSQGEYLGGYTGIWKESIYPAKIWNILEAARNLALYQEAHDGFADDDFSFMDIQKHLADPNFRQGFNYSWNLVNAGGIDAAATILSKSLLTLTQNGKAAYVKRNPNPEYFEYFQGPTDPGTTEENSDAGINIDSRGSVRGDFAWQMKGNGRLYLNIGVAIVPDGNAWSNSKSWTRLPGDRLVLTLSWTKNKPQVNQSSAIEKLMTTYGEYHDQGPGQKAWGSLIPFGSEYTINWSEANSISEVVRPEQNIRDFESEIDGADKAMSKANMAEVLLKMQKSGKKLADMDLGDVEKFYYSFIYYIKNAVNKFNALYPYTAADEKAKNPRPTNKLGTFLVSELVNDGLIWPLAKALPDFQKATYELDDNTYLRGDQSIQCLIWVSFLGKIGLPLSPLYVGGTDSATASGLVTDFVRNSLKYVDKAADPKHAELRFVRPHKIESVEVGDSFVRWGGDNNHIGTVIGKKTVNGETVLLITDANRKNDGVIRVFEVNKDNFRLIFGNDAEDLFPVVIRNDAVEKYLAGKTNLLFYFFGGR